jgi:hypothetical protein
MRFAFENTDAILFAGRLTLFLVKMAFLVRPCWPYTTNLGVGACLVAIAGMDLGLPESSRQEMLVYQGSRTGHGPSGGFGRPRSDRQERASRWRWDWRISLGLLALHFLVLWATSKLNVLCATSVNEWMEW